MCLMFIGSAPASMGGGITTGSFSVLTLAMWSFAWNYGTVRVGQRAISGATVWRALAVLMISLSVVVVVAWLLLFTQNVEFSAGLFEVVSAFSTTGLSLGVTGQLDTFGRLLIIATMFWGRLGAITIMLALVKHGTRQSLVNIPRRRCWSGEEVFFHPISGRWFVSPSADWKSASETEKPAGAGISAAEAASQFETGISNP